MSNKNPIIIIFGDNKIASKNYFYQKIQEFKSQNYQVKRFNSNDLDINKIDEALGTNNLFAEKELIIFENYLKKPLSQLKPQLEVINQAQKPIIFFDTSKIRATTYKKIAYTDIQEFLLENNLFKFLDKLSPQADKKKLINEFHQVIKTNPAPLVFAMLIRQLQMLILAKSNKLNNVAPFIKQKTNNQAQNFDIKKLNIIFNDLIMIDYEQKTSKNILPLEKKLDLFLLKM